jgi:glycosyltransferase involved in cell wall biosynthesis
MRILHLNAFYPPIIEGGAERFVAMLAETQARHGHEVSVVTLGKHTEPAHERNAVLIHRIAHGNLYWLSEWPKYPSPIRYAHKLFSGWNPIVRRRVGRIIESFCPDIINSHCMVGFPVDCWKEAAKRGVPVVHTLHDFGLFCRNANAFRCGQICQGVCFLCRVVNAPKRSYSRYLSAVVGISNDVLKRHCDVGFFGKIPTLRRTIIRNMSPLEIKARPARSTEVPFRIGFIGRIIPDKGLQVLLQAVKMLPRHGWNLLIAGKVYPPLDLKTLQAEAGGLPVQWLGFVQPEEFYQQIDLLVVPSVWPEPSGMVIHEAFANAVPVIASRLGGITDLIDDGVTGWLFEPGDVVGLSKMLEERLRTGREALPAEAAFASFQLDTTAERVARRYEDFYTKIKSHL